MQEGDIIVDGGNEWFPNSQRRAKELEAKNIMFVGMGISGGEEGARNGPSLMPGGPKEAFDALEPIITKCSAQVRFAACVKCWRDLATSYTVLELYQVLLKISLPSA